MVYADGTTYDVGGYNLQAIGGSAPTLAGAIATYGPPTWTSAISSGGWWVGWAELGITLRFTGSGPGSDACRNQGGHVDLVALKGAGRWQTAKGLTIGETLARLRELYPGALRHGSGWWLTTRYSAETGRTVPVLVAYVSNGQIIGLRRSISGGRPAARWSAARRSAACRPAGARWHSSAACSRTWAAAGTGACGSPRSSSRAGGG